jgi:hypothetical protein
MDLARANALHDEATLLMAAREAGKLIGLWKGERIGRQRCRQEAAHGTARNPIKLGARSVRRSPVARA